MLRFPSALLVSAAIALAPAAARAGQDIPPFTAQERASLTAALHATCDPTADETVKLDDAGLMEAAVESAQEELAQRARPSSVDHFWAYDPPRRDLGAEIAAARSQGRFGDWLQSISPADPRYRALIGARCRYQVIVRAGGWPDVPKSLRVSPGEARPEVRLLRRRLAVEGYLPADATASATFDEALQRALRAFQERHGLTPDGLLNVKTLTALNVSASDRLDQVEANLERWRWLPRPLPPTRLEVDVGAAQATLYRDGQPALSMRVIVGDPRHHSPLFSTARLQAVVFNPPWNVPDSIARAEILPKAARDRGYLARQNMTYVDGRLQQRPGPKNSLGQLKIDFASPFGVYLHDTPAKSLFARAVRTLSHGCMRMEKPREIAAILLANQGWTPERIDAAIAQGSTQRVELKGSPPLFVIYTTVDVAGDGAVSFRPDPYGWDDKLNDAIEPRTVVAASRRPDSDEDAGQLGP